MDKIEKQEVVVHAFKKLKKYKPSIIVSLQVNTPQFNYKDLDKGMFFKKKLYPNAPIKELISVGKNKIQNAAFRIMTPKTVCKKTLSTKIGIIITDYLDIHSKKDYEKVKKIIEKKIKLAIFISDVGFGHMARQRKIIYESFKQIKNIEITIINSSVIKLIKEEFKERCNYLNLNNNIKLYKTKLGKLDILKTRKSFKNWRVRKEKIFYCFKKYLKILIL